jgi:predicted nucleic acid-binding protein
VIAIVDTGPLYAVADRDDEAHEACLAVLESAQLELVIPALVVAEATYLIGTRLGAVAEATFLRSLDQLEVEAPEVDDWSRIGRLVEKYADLGLGGTDASVIALAERHRATTVVTLDRKHFSIVRPRHCRTFRLLPG